MNVLLVQDAASRASLAAILQDGGYRVTAVENGLAAVEQLQGRSFDLILIESFPPAPDILVLCREFRRYRETQRIPLLFYSAAATDPAAQRFALSLGADALLAGPPDPRAILARIQQALHRALTAEPKEVPDVEPLGSIPTGGRLSLDALQQELVVLRRTNRELRARERYLQAIIENEPECVKLLAADGSLLEMNKAGLRMIEADSLTQVQNRSIHSLIAEEDRAAFQELTERALRGESGTLEFRVVGFKGGRRWLETHASALRDADGAAMAVLGITRDITERKRAEEALREAEARLRLAIEAGGTGIWDWNMTTGKIIWSRRHEEMWGMAPGAFQGTYEEFQARVHPDDRAGLERAVAQALAERRTYRYEFRIIRPDGAVRWIAGQGEPLFDSAGKPTRMIGVVRDVTERKQADEALRKSEERFRLVAIATNDAVWDWDLITDALWWNDNFKSMFGYEAREIEPGIESWTNRIHPLDKERVVSGIHAAIDRGQRLWLDEYRFRRGDGSYARILDRGHIVHDQTGKPIRMIGAMLDITERKRAEEELRASRELLNNILDSSPSYIFAHDVQHRYILANEALTRLFGMTKEEILGKTEHDVFPKSVADALRAANDQIMATGTSLQVEEVIASIAGGVPRVVVTTKFPLRDAQGKVSGLGGVATDITERKRAEEALRASEERLRLALEASAMGTWDWNLQTNELIWSPNHAALFGMKPEEFDGRYDTFARRVHPDDLPGLEAAVAQARETRLPYQYEFRVIWPDKTVHWITGQGQFYYDREGQAVRMTGVVMDITARRLAEERVRRLNRVYAVLSGIDALIVRVRDRDGLFQEACRLAVETGEFSVAWIGLVDRAQMHIRPVAWSGEERGMLQAIKPYLSLHDRPDEERSLATRAVEEKRPVIVNDVERDPRVVLKETLLGREIGALAVFPLLIADEAVGVLVLLSKARGFFDESETRLLVELAGDISFALDHIDKEERIDYLAYYDSLTGLANRALFHERLVQFAHTADHARRKLALCMMDLDHFKTVNDALGRHAGDALLVQFAARLAARTGEPEQVARLGADRFAIVLLDIKDESDAIQVLERKMSEYLGEPFHVNGTELRIAAKVGVALCPDDGRDADTLFRNAEAALKKAKAGGDRCLFYTEEMTDRVAEKLVLENNLRRALENQEFVLHYQPKADAKNGRITGVEALLRWADPQAGLVPPMHFIPLLEETGMILDVGAWVIARAVQDCEYWRASGVGPLPVAVNVSAVQLRQRDFVDIVRKAVIAAPMPPPLEIEITETVVMNDIERNIEQLKGLRALGIDIAIDDFGTGYSSLGYLARLPVQVLKIDLSFISRMLAEADVQTLVSTMISLAHSLRLKVVAEGVETQQQADVLRGLMCDELQGYWIRKPVTREEITELLRDNGPTGGSPPRSTPRRSVRANRPGRKI